MMDTLKNVAVFFFVVPAAIICIMVGGVFGFILYCFSCVIVGFVCKWLYDAVKAALTDAGILKSKQ